MVSKTTHVIWMAGVKESLPTLLDFFPEDFLIMIDESPHDHGTDQGHVQWGPLAQGDAGQLWFPFAVCLGQPATAS